MGRKSFALRGLRAVVCALVVGTMGAGCGAGTLAPPRDARVTISLGATQYRADRYTDFDDVRDVTASNASVYVATDRGLLVYAKGASQAPARVTSKNGLLADDVSALALAADGSVVVATRGGITRVRGNQFEPLGVPPVGPPAAVAFDGAGALWACGPDGVAKREGNVWRLFGDRASCTTLALAKHGGLWVGTTTGLWEIEGDVIREHSGETGMPGPFVRSVAPLGNGRGVFALVDDGDGTVLAHFDGERWYGYAPRLAGVPASLVRRAGKVILVTPGAAYSVSPSSQAKDVSVVAVSASKARTARVYRGDFREGGAPSAVSADDPRRVVRRAAKAFHEGGAAVADAPSLSLAPVDWIIPSGATYARAEGDEVYVADQNRGVVETHSSQTGLKYAAGDGVVYGEFTVASAANGDVFVRGRDGDVAVLHDGALRRVAVAGNVHVDALASQGGNVYAAAVVGDAGQKVGVYQWDGQTFAPFVERDVASGGGLASVSLLAVTADGDVWVGVRVKDESAPEGRARGVVMLRADKPEVVAFHQTVAAVEGAASRPAPDDLSHIDVGEAGFAWFASLSGAVRIGQSQVVIFGEARNVPGEIVSDVATTTTGRVWIAASEGFGYFEGSAMHFESPPEVNALRPTAIAVTPSGETWVSSSRGVARNNAQGWQVMHGAEDLAPAEVRDLAADTQGRLWLLTNDGLTVLTPSTK